jgi:hypothetical protein
MQLYLCLMAWLGLSGYDFVHYRLFRDIVGISQPLNGPLPFCCVCSDVDSDSLHSNR